MIHLINMKHTYSLVKRFKESDSDTTIRLAIGADDQPRRDQWVSCVGIALGLVVHVQFVLFAVSF